jgi:hypothetical protein
MKGDRVEIVVDASDVTKTMAMSRPPRLAGESRWSPWRGQVEVSS